MDTNSKQWRIQNLVPLKTSRVEALMRVKTVQAQNPRRWFGKVSSILGVILNLIEVQMWLRSIANSSHGAFECDQPVII
ncbi:hypothetical protein TNCV_4461121 [Trichonephila clavipes]|nr:hypothetical protein TNCV_4461121 [Trichonephila clavipes]